MSLDTTTNDAKTPPGAAPQAGSVPFRLRAGRPEVCLITSRGTGQWGFPKGNIDRGKTSRQTALKETWEEAGVHGELISELTGYTYTKHGRLHAVTMYLLQAGEVLDDWPERNQRQRRWVDVAEAQRRIDRRELIPVLASAVQAFEQPPP